MDDNVIRFPTDYQQLPAEIEFELKLTSEQWMARAVRMHAPAMTGFLVELANGIAPRGSNINQAAAVAALTLMAVGYAKRQWPGDKTAREQFLGKATKMMATAVEHHDDFRIPRRFE
jgi:hypothetical protein